MPLAMQFRYSRATARRNSASPPGGVGFRGAGGGPDGGTPPGPTGRFGAEVGFLDTAGQYRMGYGFPARFSPAATTPATSRAGGGAGPTPAGVARTTGLAGQPADTFAERVGNIPPW